MTLVRLLLVALAVTGCLAGCSAHPKRVDCEQHLQPINTPAPVAKTHEPQS